jgi:hypothetical protein
MFGCSKSGDDSAFADDVFQRVEPFGKYTGSFKFDHVMDRIPWDTVWQAAFKRLSACMD